MCARIPFFLFYGVSINESICAHSQLVIHDKSFPEEVLSRRARSFAWRAQPKKKKERKEFLLYLLFLRADIIKLHFCPLLFRNGKLSNAAVCLFVTNRGNCDGKMKKDGNCFLCSRKKEKILFKESRLIPITSEILARSSFCHGIQYYFQSFAIHFFLFAPRRPTINFVTIWNVSHGRAAAMLSEKYKINIQNCPFFRFLYEKKVDRPSSSAFCVQNRKHESA